PAPAGRHTKLICAVVAGTDWLATVVNRLEDRMFTVTRWLLALALPVVALASSPNDTTAQNRERPATRPAILSFVLRHAGTVILDPFGSSGRREVLQLM